MLVRCIVVGTLSICIVYESFGDYILKYIPVKNKKSPRILELGCGPARHAIVISNLGYNITCIDIDDDIIKVAKQNSKRLSYGKMSFQIADVYEIPDHFSPDSFEAVTHGGLMEHFENEEAIRKSLREQLVIAKYLFFDVPLGTPKNIKLFERDTIFRQIWPAEYWINNVLQEFDILEYSVETHDKQGMTDDLICVIGR